MAATSKPWYRRVFKPIMVEEANPPKPFVSSHSRREASFKLSQTSRLKRIRLSLYTFGARIFDLYFVNATGATFERLVCLGDSPLCCSSLVTRPVQPV